MASPTATVDRALAAVAGSIRLLAAVTPDNASEERARLVVAARAGKPVMPAWRYLAPSDDLRRATSWLREVQKLATSMLPAHLTSMYTARIEELDLEARIALAAGSREVSDLCLGRFGDARDARRALRWVHARTLATEPDEASPIVSDADEPGSLKRRIEQLLREHELDFEVLVHPSLAALAATGDRAIYVAAGRLVAPSVAERVALHEVLAHALPRARARTASLGLFGIGTARGHDHQEGYAIWIEERAHRLDARRKRELGARHLAVRDMRAGASFVDVVTRLLEREQDPPAAVAAAERAFRGSDGRRPGLGREAVYLPAYALVRDALSRDPSLADVISCGQVSVEAARMLRSELTWEGTRRPPSLPR